MSVVLFGHNGDESGCDSLLTKVTPNFFHPEHVGFRLQDLVHPSPQVVVYTGGWWRLVVQQGLEPVNDGLVVDKDVSGALSGGDQVEEGEGFGVLGGLPEAVDARRVV